MSHVTKQKWLELDVFQEALKASVRGRLTQEYLAAARNSIKTFLEYNSVEVGYSELTERGSKAFIRCVIYAYAVRVFQQKGELCGPLARALEWFVRQTDAETQRDFWDVLLFSRQYDASKLRVADVTNGFYDKDKKVETQCNNQPDLDILLDLLSVPQCTGQEIDAIVGLIEMALYEMRTHMVQAGSSSDTGEHDMVQKALGKAVCSTKLLSLFFNPLVVNSVSRGCLSSQQHLKFVVQESTQLTWSDGRGDCDSRCTIGPRKRPDDLVVNTLRSLSLRKDVIRLISSLSDAYVSSSAFAKSQLHNKILDVIFFSENTMMFDALCCNLQDGGIKTDSFVLDCLIYLFESSFLFRELTAFTVGDFYTFVCLSVNNVSLATPDRFFETCFKCITHVQSENNREKEWCFERLSLLRFFFSGLCIPASNFNVDVFLSLGSLFLRTHLDPDLDRMRQGQKIYP